MSDHVIHDASAWLPIRTTAFDQEKHAAPIDSGIQSFLNELPAALPLVFGELKEIKVSVEEPPANIGAYIARSSSIHAPPLFRCAHVSAKVRVDQDSNEVATDNSDPDNHFDRASAAHYLSRAIDVALDLSELASPGCVWAIEGAVVVEEGIYSQNSEKVPISEFHPRTDTPNPWPSVISLPLSSVVGWARCIGMFDAPLATTRLQRALAAYTNLVGLGFRNEGECLFRAMQGLEAFYCDGVGDLRRQLSEKSQLWLGPSNSTSNIVGQLYDLRSQYVHGGAGLQYSHDLADPWEHDEKTMIRLSSGTGFATRLLVASLQRCITEEITELSWSYSVVSERRKSDG